MHDDDWAPNTLLAVAWGGSAATELIETQQGCPSINHHPHLMLLQVMGLQPGMVQQPPPPVSYAAAGGEQAPQQAALAQQMQEYAAMRQGTAAPADGVSAAEPPPQQPPQQQPHQVAAPALQAALLSWRQTASTAPKPASAHRIAQAAALPPHSPSSTSLQAGSPVFVGNDDDMNITVDVNDLQQAAAGTGS